MDKKPVWGLTVVALQANALLVTLESHIQFLSQVPTALILIQLPINVFAKA